MRGWLLALSIIALIGASSVQAGGWGRHHRPHFRHHGFHHFPHHRHHGHHDLAAGLIIGGLIGHALNHRSWRPERTVISRRVVRPEPTRVDRPRGQAAPAVRHPIYYHRDADGKCWLVEAQDNGEEHATPQPAGICD